MKLLIASLFISTTVIAASTATKKTLPVNPVHQETQKKNMAQTKPEPGALNTKTADCDEKAKKPIEITPQSISLSGNTGCSLDEVKP